MYAAFGGEWAGGVGNPEFDVTQSGGEPCAFVATQNGGNAGGVTPSEISLKTIFRKVTCGHVGLWAAAAKVITPPPPATLVVGAGVPHCLLAIKYAALSY